MGGGVDPTELDFRPLCAYFCKIENDLWTRDWTLSTPGGTGSIIYDTQPIRDRPVGGVGDFHTLREGVIPGDIHVFVHGLTELHLRGWIMILA